MTSKNDSYWFKNYEALKAYILERGHLPDKHVVENRALLSWAKYQRKKIKEGTLDAEKLELFESLLATRSTEHTGEEDENENTVPTSPYNISCLLNVPLEDGEKCIKEWASVFMYDRSSTLGIG